MDTDPHGDRDDLPKVGLATIEIMQDPFLPLDLHRECMQDKALNSPQSLCFSFHKISDKSAKVLVIVSWLSRVRILQSLAFGIAVLSGLWNAVYLERTPKTFNSCQHAEIISRKPTFGRLSR